MYGELKLALIIYLWYPKTKVNISTYFTFFHLFWFPNFDIIPYKQNNQKQTIILY